MAYIYLTHDVEIEVDEFLSNCSDREIQEIIDYLITEKKLPRAALSLTKDSEASVLESEFIEAVTKLSECRLQLSNEDTNTILKIAKRY